MSCGMPALLKSSFFLFLSLVLLLALVAWFPTPGMIFLIATLLSFVVLLQVYLVLKESNAPPAGPVKGNYKRH